MQESLSVVFLILTSIVWGITNPLIKRGSAGIDTNLSALEQFKALFRRWRYVVPWIVNLSGSILFFLALSGVRISIAVPVANSLTFIITEFVSKVVLHEAAADMKFTYLGMLLVVVGITICMQ